MRFATIVLEDILGYDSEKMSHEENNVEFMYRFDNNTSICFEAKGTKTKDLFARQNYARKEQSTPIKQLWGYMADSEFGVCTNYRDFILIIRDKGISKYHKFDFETIRADESKLKEFIGIFSKKQIEINFVADLHFKSYDEEKEFTENFYKLFHETRLMLIKEFQECGSEKSRAIYLTTIFLNRLIFMFFVEDMKFISNRRLFRERILGVLEPDQITEHTKKVYDEIKDLFKAFDEGSPMLGVFGFNGGLFSDKFPEDIRFGDLHNKKFFLDVMQRSAIKGTDTIDERTGQVVSKYPDLNPIIYNLLIMESFDFNTEVNVNILGHIFEQSISDIEELQGKDDFKRKKEGVYYTPEYITDYICRNTIIPYLSKSNRVLESHELVEEYSDDIEVLEQKFRDVKILDPACGSGAFLIKAVDVLLEVHKEIQDYKHVQGRYRVGDQFTLTKWNEESEARSIIEANIFGVDVNQQSVEITKLAMFLKTASQTHKLPDLSSNIQSGNSVISDKEITPNAFEWERQFPAIFGKSENGGFDIVIGNPPYVRQESLESKESMQLPPDNSLGLSNFVIPSKSDLSCYFYYHSLNRLKKEGKIGFIASDSWMSYDYGKTLQQVMLDKSTIHLIMRTEFNVFDDADVRTVTVILDRQIDPERVIELIYVKKRDFITNPHNIMTKSQKSFKPGNWNRYFQKRKFSPKIKMVEMACTGDVKYGKKTGCDKFFVLSKETISEYGITKKYRKPVISKDIHGGLLEDSDAVEYLLDVNDPKGRLVKDEQGKKVLKYIEKAENTKIIPKKGTDKKPRKISELASVSNHNPWYSLNLKPPPPIFLGIFANKRMKMYENNGNFHVRNNFVYFVPHNVEYIHAFLAYLSSSWFSLHQEIIGHPAGAGALQFMTVDYKKAPVPDFNEIPKKNVEDMKKSWIAYRNDFDQDKLDKVVLKILGFTPDECEMIKNDLESSIKRRTESKKRKNASGSKT